jgi:putative tricarboxylic transport membrane protein
MNKTHIALGVAVLGVAVIYGIGAMGFPAEVGYAGIGSRFFPTVVAVLLATCAVGLIWQSASGGLRNLADQTNGTRADWPAWAWVSAGLIANALLIDYVGFTLAGTVLFVLAARGFGNRQYLKNIGLGIALSLPVFLLFTKVLAVSLPALIKGWI